MNTAMTILRKHFHLLLALAFVLAMPLTMQSGSLASEVLIYGLAAMGCNLLLGHTGLLSFGQGIFFGLGSYTIALTLTRWPLPMPLALALAVVAGAVGAALVGWVAIRQRGTYFVMLTLAFAQMFYFLAYSMPGLTGGDNGLMDIPAPRWPWAASRSGRSPRPGSTTASSPWCSWWPSGCCRKCRPRCSAAPCWPCATTRSARAPSATT